MNFNSNELIDSPLEFLHVCEFHECRLIMHTVVMLSKSEVKKVNGRLASEI